MVQIHRKYLRITTAIFVPIVLELCAIAKPLIITLIGEKWIDSIPLLQILCFAHVFDTIININTQALLAKGCTNLVLEMNFTKKIFAFIILFASLKWGLVIICLGKVLYVQISSVITVYYAKRILNIGYFKQIKDILPICFVAAISSFCGYMITEDYHKNFFFNPLQTCTECSTASKPPTEYYNSDEAIADYNSLRFYCQWRRKHESEDDLANLLLDRQKNWHDWKFTALQAFQKHFNRLPQELLNEVLQDGISAKIHDKLMILQHTCQEADAPCGEQELARECSINDYNFRLIPSIIKYRAITRYNMIPRRSYRNLTDKAMYAIERNGRYLGVFKVKGNIVEEESPQDYDDIITRTKCHIAYLTWVNHHNLERNNYWPEDCETALKQEFSIEPIKNNEFDNLRLEEMLNLPNKDLRPGFFLSLYRKFAEVTLLYPPSPSPSDNEQEYLLKNFPWGRQIYQAAFAGNPEAQYVMSLFYQDNYCITASYRLAEQWYKRARANGWLEIAPAKKDVRIDFMTMKHSTSTL